MSRWRPLDRAVLYALDEPALVLEGKVIEIANEPAQKLLGMNIQGRDVRLVIRHPQVLEHIFARRAAEVDITGIGDVERNWRVKIRFPRVGATFIRLIDRSTSIAADQMRAAFVARASNELSKRLSTVLGYAETLAEEPDLSTDLRAQFAGSVRHEAAGMLRVVEDLMTLSRIEAERFAPLSRSVRIDDVVRRAIVDLSAAAAQQRCALEADIAHDLRPVLADEVQLVQAVDNLISNALQYGCQKPGSVVQVSAKGDDRWIFLTVTDRGPGIASEHLPRLTDRFFRVDPDKSRQVGGTGLGLSIVKQIVDRHGGSLSISSRVGRGTEVSIRLPAGP